MWNFSPESDPLPVLLDRRGSLLLNSCLVSWKEDLFAVAAILLWRLPAGRQEWIAKKY